MFQSKLKLGRDPIGEIFFSSVLMNANMLAEFSIQLNESNQTGQVLEVLAAEWWSGKKWFASIALNVTFGAIDPKTGTQVGI